MEKMEWIRKRSDRWNEEDKMLLKELIRKRAKHIEMKNTATHTTQAKKQSWLEVEKIFNELCTGGQKSMFQLKLQWAATKFAARKKLAEHRKEVSETGGGSQPTKIPVNSNVISAKLPTLNGFDSDFLLKELSNEVIEEPKKQEINGTEIHDEAKLPEVLPKATPILKKETSLNNNNVDEETRKAKNLSELFYHQFIKKDNEKVKPDPDNFQRSSKKHPPYKCIAITKVYAVIPSYVKVARILNCDGKSVRQIIEKHGDMALYEHKIMPNLSNPRIDCEDADIQLNQALNRYVIDYLNFNLDPYGETPISPDTNQKPILNYKGTLKALKPVEEYISIKDNSNVLALMHQLKKHLTTQKNLR